ncbi:hypothetical protein RvY_10137 [Ramazzottius varieornatus]|uniref:BTB domain-containing protein n=1 Tax=Ramazzottius varieornatus TaxID=947166 RepID=A0A1D1VJK1_RAMVA|nr:hypothetical protein RvY_10137 [Ramazzottius varieornatus]
MAVRYNSGPEAQICAGFQITLLQPSQLSYRGIQETIKEHREKLQETSKKSNAFKRGKKGWVLRKFANREQLRLCKKSSIVFVLSFCIYGREQTQFRHRFSKGTEDAESAIASHMKRLWNNGNPAGRVRMEAKNGKIFRVHSQVLQLNGGVLSHLADKYSLDQKQPLRFPDLTEAVLKKLLEYCYTLQVTGLNRTPFELLLAAHRYDLKGLQHLVEREIARNIDLDNVIDLHIWNEALQSPFLAEFIRLFLTVNYAQLRLQPEFSDKLTPLQQLALDQKYRRPELEPDMSEGREGFISDDDDDDDGNDSGLESQDDVRMADRDPPPGEDDDDDSDDFPSLPNLRTNPRAPQRSSNTVIRMAPVTVNQVNQAPVFHVGVHNNPEELEEGQGGEMVIHGANGNMVDDVEDVAVLAHLFHGIGDIDPEALELMWMFM